MLVMRHQALAGVENASNGRSSSPQIRTLVSHGSNGMADLLANQCLLNSGKPSENIDSQLRLCSLLNPDSFWCVTIQLRQIVERVLQGFGGFGRGECVLD